MSEPLTAIEIEDVLSSIRRLVSEDLRPTHKLVTAALQNGSAKLILTPALRVVPNEQRDFVPSGDALDEPGDLQSVLDRIDPAESDEAVEMLPMFGSVRLQEMANVQAFGDAAGDDTAADANFLASAMSRINGLDVADPARGGQPETIEAVVAAVGAAVGPDEWEVDGGDPAPQAKAWEDTVWNSGDKGDAGLAQSDDTEVLVLSDPVMAEQGLTVADSLGAGADQLAEDLVSIDKADVTDTGAEATLAAMPAAAEAGDLSGSDSTVFQEETLPGRAVADRRNTADDAQDSPDVDGQDRPHHADDVVGYLNEDLLRDIVRDMIQAELQGTLGERITRNVRKLVRSEINRALAARDYE